MLLCIQPGIHYNAVQKIMISWWRHQMETFSALLAICAESSSVTGEFSAQRPVTRNFDVFVDLRLNKRLSKQSWGWLFETPSRQFWRHCNDSIHEINDSSKTSIGLKTRKNIIRSNGWAKEGLSAAFYTKRPLYIPYPHIQVQADPLPVSDRLAMLTKVLTNKAETVNHRKMHWQWAERSWYFLLNWQP